MTIKQDRNRVRSPDCGTSCLCLLDSLCALSPTVRRAQETAVTVSGNVVFFLCSPIVNWRPLSPRLRPTNICVIQKSDTDLIPLWEPSQSTYWKLALASHSRHLPAAPGSDSGFTSFTATEVCKARHPRLLFFTITCLNIPTLLPPHDPKKKITQYICEISEHCLCQHVPCVCTLTIQKRSPTHLLQVMCF